MRILIAAFSFLLSLFGCDDLATTVVTHTRSDGMDVLYSRTRTQPGVARFECIASASGECHYALFPRKCANSPGSCGDDPMDRLTIPAGGKREVIGLSRFDACVTADAAPLQRDCLARL